MQKLEELTAIFKGERFRFENSDGDVIIGNAKLIEDGKQARGNFTIKGAAEIDELQELQTYRFYGKWSKYTNQRTGIEERQFHFQTFVQSKPHGRSGIVNYLHQAGVGNGIGWKRAGAIWDKFGGDAIRTLKEEPEVIAAAIRGLSVEEATRASEWLKEREHLENCTMEITDLLNGRGFPKKLARTVIKKWGNEAKDKITKNPYRLLQFEQVGFKRCDSLYLDLGNNPNRLRRQAFCVWHSIHSDNSGHTWFPLSWVVNRLNQLVGSSRPARAIKMAKRLKLIDSCRVNEGAIVDEGGKIWLAEQSNAANELAIGKSLASISNETILWPSPDEIENIDDHQREQLNKAIAGPVGILGGGPGTGKTFTAANLIKAVAKKVGYENIAVAAPTGKAAVRITEVMDGYGIPIVARTWHSLLMHAGQAWHYKVLIGDETSMNDTDLMAAVLRARSVGCHVLLIGDINQLPPVGHGAPLRDMIQARLPYGELTEIKRNSGGIVETCQAIREGSKLPNDSGNLIWKTVSVDNQINVALETCLMAGQAGFDPIWDCQTLVAVNEKSPLARKAMNQILQRELNEDGETNEKNKSGWRVGDKVICLKNGRFKLADESEADDDNEDGEAYVANGELAKVIEVEAKRAIVEVISPKRTVIVPSGANWDLGYAISCHKSQGSEWPVVIVMLDEYPGAKMVCSREWLYTAISRAKEKCFLIGKKQVAESMRRRTAIDKRKTFLRERIELERAKMEVVEL